MEHKLDIYLVLGATFIEFWHVLWVYFLLVKPCSDAVYHTDTNNSPKRRMKPTHFSLLILVMNPSTQFSVNGAQNLQRAEYTDTKCTYRCCEEWLCHCPKLLLLLASQRGVATEWGGGAWPLWAQPTLAVTGPTARGCGRKTNGVIYIWNSNNFEDVKGLIKVKKK